MSQLQTQELQTTALIHPQLELLTEQYKLFIQARNLSSQVIKGVSDQHMDVVVCCSTVSALEPAVIKSQLRYSILVQIYTGIDCTVLHRL